MVGERGEGRVYTCVFFFFFDDVFGYFVDVDVVGWSVVVGKVGFGGVIVFVFGVIGRVLDRGCLRWIACFSFFVFG